MIFDDPDATGTYVHWVIFNIPGSARGLDAAIPSGAELDDGSIQGRNSSYTNGYFGPCPPVKHRYFFKLYALDATLSLSGDATKGDVLAAIEGHVLANAELMGTFEKYSD